MFPGIIALIVALTIITIAMFVILLPPIKRRNDSEPPKKMGDT